MQAAKRRGSRLGRPQALGDEQRERLVRLHRLGHSQRAIAQAVGVGKGTIAREVARLRPVRATG